MAIIDLGLNLDVDVTVTGEMGVRRKEEENTQQHCICVCEEKWWFFFLWGLKPGSFISFGKGEEHYLTKHEFLCLGFWQFSWGLLFIY